MSPWGNSSDTEPFVICLRLLFTSTDQITAVGLVGWSKEPAFATSLSVAGVIVMLVGGMFFSYGTSSVILPGSPIVSALKPPEKPSVPSTSPWPFIASAKAMVTFAGASLPEGVTLNVAYTTLGSSGSARATSLMPLPIEISFGKSNE